MLVNKTLTKSGTDQGGPGSLEKQNRQKMSRCMIFTGGLSDWLSQIEPGQSHSGYLQAGGMEGQLRLSPSGCSFRGTMTCSPSLRLKAWRLPGECLLGIHVGRGTSWSRVSTGGGGSHKGPAQGERILASL